MPLCKTEVLQFLIPIFSQKKEKYNYLLNNIYDIRTKNNANMLKIHLM